MSDLAVTADYRIQFAVSGHLYQVSAILAQSFVILLRILAGYLLVAPHAVKGLQERILGDIHLLEYSGARCGALVKEGQIHMFNADIFIAELFCLLFRVHKDQLEPSGGIHLVAASGHLRKFFQSLFKFCRYNVAVFPHVFEKFRYQPVFLLHESKMEMFPVYLLMAFLDTYILTVHYRALRVLCVLFYVHIIASHCPCPDPFTRDFASHPADNKLKNLQAFLSCSFIVKREKQKVNTFLALNWLEC